MPCLPSPTARPHHIDGCVFLLHAGHCAPACQPTPLAPTRDIHAYEKRLCTNPSGASSAWQLRPRHSVPRCLSTPYTATHLPFVPSRAVCSSESNLPTLAPTGHENDTRKATPGVINPLRPHCSSNMLISCHLLLLSSLTTSTTCLGPSPCHHAISWRLPGQSMLFAIHAARFMHCRCRLQGPSTSPCTLLRLFSGLELHNQSRPCCVTRLHSNILFRLSSACVNHPPSMQINHNVLFRI
jgi:hypothetical protein